MIDESDPPSPHAQRLFEAERRRSTASAELTERLLGRIQASVLAESGVARAGEESSKPTSDERPSAPRAPSNAPAAGGGTKAAAAGLTVKAAPWIALAFAVGTGAGAALHAALAPSSSNVSAADAGGRPFAPVSASSAAAAPSASSNDSMAPAALSDAAVGSNAGGAPSTALVAPSEGVLPGRAPAATNPGAIGTASASAPSPSNGPDSTLASERALVERARTALGRGEFEQALLAVNLHATRFPHGRLEEEREVIAIKALARLHRDDEASDRAKAFRKRHPDSVFLPTLPAVQDPPP